MSISLQSDNNLLLSSIITLVIMATLGILFTLVRHRRRLVAISGGQEVLRGHASVTGSKVHLLPPGLFCS